MFPGCSEHCNAEETLNEYFWNIACWLGWHHTGKYRDAAQSICNLMFNMPNETPLVFHNSSNYDYHFIIKELASKFEGQFECLGHSTEKYKTFSIPIPKKVTKIDRDGNESVVTTSHKIKFIDNVRFTVTSSSNHLDNLTEGIHKIKCKDCDCFVECEGVKDNLVKYKCLLCNKDYSSKIAEELKKRFKNTFKFSNNDINKLILLSRKGAYPCEYMNEWEKLNETTFSQIEEIYSNLKMEDVTDADYRHAKGVCKDFNMKKLGEYHDLYLKSYTLLLADVFQNFRKMCLNIYHLAPAKFLSVSELAWKADLKRTKVKLKLLTDIDMLLMVEKRIRRGICHTIY